MSFVFATFWFWLSAALAAVPPASVGGRLDDSIVIDVTEDGLAQLEPAVEAFVPSEPILVPDYSTRVLGLVDVSVRDLAIDVEVDDVTVTPTNDRIDLVVEATVAVNSQNSPARATILGLGCNFYLTPFTVRGTTSAFMSLPSDPFGVDFDRDGIPDTRRLEVVFGDIVVTDTASGANVKTPGCALGAINTALSVFGINAFDAIINAVRPSLLAVIEDLPDQITPLLEEPFESFVVAEEINLLGVPLFIALWPEDLIIDRDGIRVGLASFVDVPASACVAEYGIDGYVASTAPLPSAPYPESPVARPHVAGFVEDDFANLALWSVWSGGLLCLDLADPDNAFTLPFSLDSSLLSLLSPDGTWAGVFEESVPLSIRTDPKSPPVVDLSAGRDVTMVVDPVGLVIEGEVAGRRTRLLDLEVTARLGADLDFDGTTGALGIRLGEIDDASVDVMVAHNDFAPDLDAEIEAETASLLVDVAGPIVDEQLAYVPLAIDLPSFDGFGLQSLDTAPSASDGSILGAYALVGSVPYSGGCTDGGGCDQGCTSTGLPAGTTLGFLVGIGLIVARRRR